MNSFEQVAVHDEDVSLESHFPFCLTQEVGFILGLLVYTECLFLYIVQ